MKQTILTALACTVLAMPVFAQEEDNRYTSDWFGNGTYDVEENVNYARVPETLAEAVESLPALPQAEELCSQSSISQAASTAASYKLAIEQAGLNALKEAADIHSRLDAANAGHNTQNEADDNRNIRFGEITAEIQRAGEEFNQLLLSYTGNGASDNETQRYGTAYVKLREQLRDDWKNCSEAKEIEAIETRLQSRTDEWIATLNTKADEVPYPAWWTAGRTKENALIDRWNSRAAVRWLKIAQEGEQQFKAVFGKLAKLEEENEQLAAQGEADNTIYLTNKLLLNGYMQQLVRFIQPYEDALRFPFIEHVEETGSAIPSKG